MSIAAAWPQCLAFFGTPLVIEPSPGQFSGSAGRLPLLPFDQRIGLTQVFPNALDGPRDPDCTAQRVLAEIVRLSSDAEKSRHERYLPLLPLIQRRYRELADPFDDLRRWTVLRQRTCRQSQELLNAEEFGRFSSETRGAVQMLRGIISGPTEGR